MAQTAERSGDPVSGTGDPPAPSPGSSLASAGVLTSGRRGFLAGAGATSLAFWLRGACVSDGDAVQVAVVWSAAEQRVFLDVVERFESPVNVVSGGDDIDAFLRGRADAHNFPDVAIVSRPSLVREYARLEWLEPLPPALKQRFPPWWRDLVTGDAGRDAPLYGAWVKAAHKSLFWWRPSLVDGDPHEWSWEDLKEWAKRRAAEHERNPDVPPPFALGAGDGWVLTDWFENLLAAFARPELYRSLAAGEACWHDDEVRDALIELGDLWQTPGLVAGGADATMMEFEESVRQVVEGKAAMLFEGDFVAGFVDRYARPGQERPQPFRLRDIAGRTPRVVGGDVAVVRRGSRRGVALVEWLTDVLALEPWMAQPGYLTPNQQVPPADGYRDDVQVYIAGDMLRTSADDLRFDLSDQLPALLTGADGVGSWKIMTDFFTEVSSRSVGVGTAVDRAIGRFNDGARQAGAARGCSL